MHVTRSGADGVTESAARLTCLVADDHPAVLEAIGRWLEDSGVSVVGRARDGAEALEQIEARRPDVALVDVRMPKLSGIDVAREASHRVPATAIVLYTGFGDSSLVREALDAGVRGLVLKKAPLEEVIWAVQEVAAGRQYVDPALTRTVGVPVERPPDLSPREREVLRLLSEGLANEEIGRRLFISAETVRTHIRKAMMKLDAGTRTEAVAKALRLHLIA